MRTANIGPDLRLIQPQILPSCNGKSRRSKGAVRETKKGMKAYCFHLNPALSSKYEVSTKMEIASCDLLIRRLLKRNDARSKEDD